MAWKIEKLTFFNFLTPFWPIMVQFVPPERYLNALNHFQRCTGPLDTKKVKESWKSQSFNFVGHIYRLRCAWEVLKSDPKAWFWCSLSLGRDFGICQVVSKCLLMFLRHLGGSKMTQSKKCHFSAPIPYWKQPYLDLIFAGISHLLFGGFNAFSSPIG